jgi:hypothetical protein
MNAELGPTPSPKLPADGKFYGFETSLPQDAGELSASRIANHDLSFEQAKQ